MEIKMSNSPFIYDQRNNLIGTIMPFTDGDYQIISKDNRQIARYTRSSNQTWDIITGRTLNGDHCKELLFEYTFNR